MARRRGRGGNVAGSMPRAGFGRRRFANRRGDSVAWGDWIIGGGAVPAGGAVGSITAHSSWGTPFTLQHGVAENWLLVTEPTISPGTGTPTMGEVLVQEVMGIVFLTLDLAAPPGDQVHVAIGLYVAEYNKTGTAWSTLDPLDTTEASRDDWLFLRGMEIGYIASGTSAFTNSFPIPVAIPAPQMIGKGETLMLSVSAFIKGGSAGSAGLVATPYVRSRITRAA